MVPQPLCLIPLRSTDFNNLEQREFIFEGSPRGERILPDKSEGEYPVWQCPDV